MFSEEIKLKKHISTLTKFRSQGYTNLKGKTFITVVVVVKDKTFINAVMRMLMIVHSLPWFYLFKNETFVSMVIIIEYLELF